MSKGIELIDNFIGRAVESGIVCKVKCLECGAVSISITMGEDIDDLVCSDCDSDFVDVEDLN